MKNSIYPCLAIKGKIAAASDFYIQTFGEGKVSQNTPFVIQIELSGQKFMLLNEGPSSTPNPSISFMVVSENPEETEKYWNKLIEEGKALMPLDSYDWSPKYGWVEDKYGVSWQLFTGSKGETGQKFSPTLMFTGANAGKAAAAMERYTKLFSNAHVGGVLYYTEEDGDNPEFVKHAQFKIKDSSFMAMDSSAAHAFTFNDGVSLVVECENQEEIDKYWSQLTSNGGYEVACGWLTDQYGISWQIIPADIIKWVTDPERSARVMNVMMKMKKLVIADLENA
ncbi:Glyoxalase superfamily enzyme, possibly 3-demethylubiquinone-9 3-methyltransferase [Pedobacter steynii]|uniref:Glyoxalase superfamily enzyme, possibly 3-demethylubiquinone-9 3-methyltransferase n=1 Tax=Pedobacter steynii TaxID=430522 RepID=A0A1G9U532_9SPHI|nr:VOC family protein [Pedobacter steynii]NQX40657.1 VOC family protein [Pedobacter steynii]SDM54962.1 Glyoxalase superfamily enzyme, possibly 3-demethylubiquinone-9 3-methyltransferase [Pedobacter steynii]